MGENTYPPAPSASYVEAASLNYGLYNSKGQYYFNPALGISSEYVSPATLPNYPIQQGGNARQLTANTQNNFIFNALNAQSLQVKCGLRSQAGPIFSSYRELMAYTQAQYSQAIPGTTSTPTYSIETLFNPQQTCVTYSTIVSIDVSGVDFSVPSTTVTRANVTFDSTSVVTLQIVNVANPGGINSIQFNAAGGYSFAATIIKIENQIEPTSFNIGLATRITLTPIAGQLQSYSLIQLILPAPLSAFTSVVVGA